MTIKELEERTGMTRLEGDKAAIDRAVEVCRQLEQSQVEYGALDPKPWLKQLEQPQRPQLAPPTRYAPPKDEEPVDYAYYHPWKRWLARMLDVAIHGLVIDALILSVFRWNYLNAGRLATWFVGLLGLGFTLICEPFWLHFWGWTPGKWIFGLKVRDRWGRKLSIGQGFLRSGGVFTGGYGCDIPIVNLWCAWKFWKRYKNEEDCPWDDETTYVHEGRRLSWLMWLVAMALAIFLAVTMVLQTNLPPNRGNLTVAEFSENFNYYLDIMGDFNKCLDQSGRWMEQEQPGMVVIDLSSMEYADPEFTVVDGHVTAVTMADTLKQSGGYGDQFFYMSQTYYQIATLALAGAQKKFNCFNLDASGWLALWNDKWDSFELDWRGLHISQTVECSGYEGTGQIRSAVEGQEQSYSRTVTISLNGSEK